MRVSYVFIIAALLVVGSLAHYDNPYTGAPYPCAPDGKDFDMTDWWGELYSFCATRCYLPGSMEDGNIVGGACPPGGPGVTAYQACSFYAVDRTWWCVLICDMYDPDPDGMCPPGQECRSYDSFIGQCIWPWP